MKKLVKKFALVPLLLTAVGVFGQFTVKRLNDPSIVAQHKRMVFQSWGDWRPYPKYLLGIQTNFAYATVWGMWAPSRNRDYKDGEDIRPLKPTGLQNQRFTQVKFQEEEAKRSRQHPIRFTNGASKISPIGLRRRLMHPLWLLYYKRMLKPITEFPDTPQNFVEWRLKNQQTYETLNTTGTLKRLQEELDLIKEKYAMSRTMDMPRGKRFLMYHDTLLKWRRFVQELRKHNDKTTLLLDYKNILKNHSPYALPQAWTPASDKQIIHNTMQQYKHKF
ncbi:hypothetical protein LDL59_13625 [Kaistella anthropi]|nr:hypothetical protein [Kaistella anthropi]